MPQLKIDFDSGAPGDKLAVLDVGMVPLGTDDEAVTAGAANRRSY